MTTPTRDVHCKGSGKIIGARFLLLEDPTRAYCPKCSQPTKIVTTRIPLPYPRYEKVTRYLITHTYPIYAPDNRTDNT